MIFDSKVDSCISPNNNYSKNNSRFQQNSLMDGLSDASKKKNIKNIAESTLMHVLYPYVSRFASNNPQDSFCPLAIRICKT